MKHLIYILAISMLFVACNPSSEYIEAQRINALETYDTSILPGEVTEITYNYIKRCPSCASSESQYILVCKDSLGIISQVPVPYFVKLHYQKILDPPDNSAVRARKIKNSAIIVNQ